MLKVESEVLARSLAFFFLNKSGKLKYAVIFPHKGKSVHHSKLQIVLFVCSHNMCAFQTTSPQPLINFPLKALQYFSKAVFVVIVVQCGAALHTNHTLHIDFSAKVCSELANKHLRP